MFELKRTYADPSSLENGQRGFPSPGSGAQTTGYTSPSAMAQEWILNKPERPTQGRRTFWDVVKEGVRQGFPSPNAPDMRRPRETFNPNPAGYQPDGRPHYVRGPDYSKGTARDVPNYGKVLVNPIGAGVVALYRPQASYGPAAQYVNGVIYWTSQAVPTSVNLQGLTDPRALEAVLGPINVQAAIRVG